MTVGSSLLIICHRKTYEAAQDALSESKGQRGEKKTRVAHKVPMEYTCQRISKYHPLVSIHQGSEGGSRVGCSTERSSSGADFQCQDVVCTIWYKFQEANTATVKGILLVFSVVAIVEHYKTFISHSIICTNVTQTSNVLTKTPIASDTVSHVDILDNNLVVYPLVTTAKASDTRYSHRTRALANPS